MKFWYTCNKQFCYTYIQITSDLKGTQRTIVDILRDSLADKPFSTLAKRRSLLDHTQHEVRYKLIIDPSEDGSITRLLFMFGILKREKTRTFMCSDFPGDNQLQKVCIKIATLMANYMSYLTIDQHNSCYQTLSC